MPRHWQVSRMGSRGGDVSILLFGAGLALSALLIAPAGRAEVVPFSPTPVGEHGSAIPPAGSIDIMEFRVEGNTLLSVIEIEEAVYPFLGSGRTTGDLEAARAALEAAYGAKGYETVTADIPPQDLRGEVITLQVVERPVGRLRVRGSRYFSLAKVKEQAPSVAEGTVPNFDRLRDDVIDLNLLADRRVTPELKTGVAPATVDVDLKVEDQFPLHGSIELNNRKSRDTEPLRLDISLRYDNLWQRGDSISFAYQTAPQRTSDSEVYSGSYLARIPDSRVSLLLYGLRSKSDVASVGDINVIGDGEIIGGRALWPFTIEAGFVQSLSAGMDYKHFGEDTEFGSDVTSAPITYYPLTIGYAANWSEDDDSRNEVGANVVFTFGNTGSSSSQFQNKREGADPSFIYLTAEAARTQELPRQFQLVGRVAGQATGQELISNEQFSLGGIDTVRGYLESEALGDYGIALQTEFRSPPLATQLEPHLNEFRLLGFFDFGAAGIHNPQREQDASFTLGSVGFGARLKVFDHLGGTVDVAFPLYDGPDTDRGHIRTNFRAWGEF
jgi:hemolysin activation/secretion protein